RDLTSSNGTYLNGSRIEQAQVFDGYAVKIGQHEGRVHVNGIDGRPMRAKTGGNPAIIIAAVVVVILGIGGAGLHLFTQKKNAEGVAGKQRLGDASRKEYEGKFGDRELIGAAKALGQVFEQRLQTSESLAEQWTKYKTEVAEYNALLGKLVKSGDRESAELV